MYAVVKIGDTGIPMLSNAATAIYYKQVFKKDLLVFLNRVSKANGDEPADGTSEIIPELAYIMAVQAEKSGIYNKNYDTFIEWLEQFEAFDLERAAVEIFDVYTKQTKTSTKPKNA